MRSGLGTEQPSRPGRAGVARGLERADGRQGRMPGDGRPAHRAPGGMSEREHPFRVRAPLHEPVAVRESSVPARDLAFDHVADVVVVGGGCAGLCAALFSAWLGEEVVLLEKAPELGGTTAKSSFWYWVPNNGPLQEAGLEDGEEAFYDYCARVARPERYLPDSPTRGVDPWEFAHYRAIYESTWPAVKLSPIAACCPSGISRAPSTTKAISPRTRSHTVACSLRRRRTQIPRTGESSRCAASQTPDEPRASRSARASASSDSWSPAPRSRASLRPPSTEPRSPTGHARV